MKNILIILTLLLLSGNAYADGDGRKTVSSAGTAEALSATSTLFKNITVCVELNNTGNIAVGLSPVAAANSDEGIILDAGDCYSPSTSGNLSTLQIDATVNGDGVTYHYEN